MQTELQELQKKLVKVIEYSEKKSGKLEKVGEEANRKVCDIRCSIRVIRLVTKYFFTVHRHFRGE